MYQFTNVLLWLLTGCVVAALSKKGVPFEASYADLPTQDRCLGSCLCDDESQTVNCSGKDYDYVPYGIPTTTLTLDLSHNSIKVISPGSFQDLHNVTSLDLSYNEISIIAEESFNMMEHLKVLRFTNNGASFVIPLDTFKPLQNLEEVYFSYTPTAGLLDGIFTAQNKLTVLNIDSIGVFPNSLNNVTFEGLNNLRELSVQASYLFEVPMDVMQPFRETLRKLSMRYNTRMTEVGTPGNQKPDFPGLEELDFAYCQTSLIAPQAFSGVPKLKFLDLRGNYFFILLPGAFAGMSNLQVLDMSSTSLIDFPTIAMQPVSESLLDLRISGGYISEIRNISRNASNLYFGRLESLRIEQGNLGRIAEDSFFKNLTSLKYLSLANNRFSRLPSNALLHLESVETADFSGNPITSISGSDIPRLPTLRHLLISSTNIDTLHDDPFSSVTLQSLKLDGNKLTNISATVLAQQTNLTYLDISSNLLQTPDVNWFAGRPTPFKKVSLSGNPWNCDCEMTEFFDWMETDEYLQIEEIDAVICENPRKVKGYPLPLLKESDLSCEIGECPTSCICTEISTGMRFAPTWSDIIAASSQNVPHLCKDSKEMCEAYVSPLDILTHKNIGKTRAVTSFQADCTGSKLTEIPKVPDTTEYMNVAQNLITQLKRGDLTYLHQIKTFIASDNQIEFVEDGCFEGLDLIEIINMNKNRMSQAVETSWFSNLTSLQQLRLDDNYISAISPLAFSDLSNLDFLDLSRNSITTLAVDTFTGLERLTYLNLAANRISSINENAFQGLPKLKYLYLNGNYMASIPSGMIRMNLNLEFLDLSQNSFRTISDNFLESESLLLLKMEYGNNPTLRNGTFRGLPNLEVLRLQYSSISRVEEEAWLVYGVSKLHTLDVAFNFIESIPLGAFEPLVNLESLGLGGNQISEVPNWESSRPLLPKLKTLFLADNPITDIPAGSVISTFENLTALVMNECSLTRLPADALRTTQLQYLVIDNNPITGLDDDVSLLKQLREIQFSSASSLLNISEGAFSSLTNLRRIVLSDSLLSEIRPNTFSSLKNLEVIDISNNKLTQPRAEWFTDLDASKVKSVVLYGNPWECDCNAVDYKKWLDNGASGLNDQFFSLTCSSPQMYKGWTMSEISYSNDVCSTDSTFTPSAIPLTTVTTTTQETDGNCEKCTYYEVTKTGNCSDAALRNVPRGCFPADIEKLDLSGNMITEIQSGDFANLRDLDVLDLKGNRIQQIADEAFKDLQRLSSLDLSLNILSEVPSSALSRLDASLLVLDLSYQRINSLGAESLPLTNLVELSMRAVHDSAFLQRLAMEDFAFAKLPSLTKLDLSQNKVSDLGKNTLTGLHELLYLNMVATNISSFPYQSLWRLTKLTDLILDDNSIQSLGHSTVPLLESLQRLSLRNNYLRTITDDCFLNSCAEVQQLDLGVNSLTKIPTSLLMSYKPKLEVLRLDHSRITAVYVTDFPSTTRGIVDLSNSVIQAIGAGSFKDMEKLSQLFLNNNSISWIADDSFTNSGLQFLDLSHNLLEYISCAWMDGLQNANHATVDVSGNRFDCSCGMIGYRHYIGLPTTQSTVTGDICASPEEFIGANVENVDLEDMQSYCNENVVSPGYCGTPPTEPQTTAFEETTITPTAQIQTTSGSARLHNMSLIFVFVIFLALKNR